MATAGNASSHDTCVMIFGAAVFAAHAPYGSLAVCKVMTHDAFLPVDSHYAHAQTVNRKSCHDASSAVTR